MTGFDGVEVADTFYKRWRGMRPTSRGRSMIFRGSSVHGFGMKESLWAVGLDAGNVVVGVRRLDPLRIVRIRRAVRILEIPADQMPPAIGEVLLIAGSQ